jgi:uncharacterized protein YegP (UPF0339 family)
VSEPWRYKWFVDGVQQTPQNIDWLKSNGYIDTDGKTIKMRVPEREFRWVLQNETKGQNQQRVSHVQYDWVRIWTSKGGLRSMKVIVFRSKDRDYRWSLRSDNGEVIADSGEGYRRRSYAIKKAEELFPKAELVIEE